MASKRSLPTYRKLVGHKIPITDADLRKVPLNDRVLLIGLWHAANELFALRKMILLADKAGALGDVEQAAKSLNSLLLIKMFALKSKEAWTFYREARDKIADFESRYLSAADRNIGDIQTELGEYFVNNENWLKTIRDKVAGHYDYAAIKSTCETTEAPDSYIFLTDQQGNSIYWIAEEIIATVLADLRSSPIDKANGSNKEESATQLPLSLRTAISDAIDDANRAASLLCDLAQEVSIVVLDTYLDSSRTSAAPEQTVRARVANNAEIPPFVDFSRKLYS